MTKVAAQGLWIGAELSVMEQLSISSFLRNGHEYHLYVYGEVAHVPEGTVLKDGNEILPASEIFQYRNRKSYAAFSNFFRYKLLWERGGWWVDMDIVCLKPFDCAEDYVFASEMARAQQVVSSGVIKTPAASPPMSDAWQTCRAKNPELLVWGEVGPKLLGEVVERFSLNRYVKRPEVFSPLGYKEWREVLEPGRAREFAEDTLAIHLWNEMWRRNGQDKNHPYDPECLYERLKRKYLPQ